jgi:hypothetical protein
LAASNCWSFDSKVSFNEFFLFTEMAVSINEEAVEEVSWKDIWLHARGEQFFVAEL